MSNNHQHQHNHHHHNTTGNIKVAFFLNLGFTIIEIIGGFLTNSVAILSDAVHDLGDSLSLGMAWYFQHLSHKNSDNKYSYGYKRFSLLGAIINSIVLIVGSIFILTEAIPRIINPEPTQVEGMFLLAILGVLVNGAAVLRLKKGSSINEKVVSLHLLEDVLGWLAILVGSIIMYFFDIPELDPIMSVGIAFFVLFNVIKNIRQTLRIILQGIPEEIDSQKIRLQLIKLDKIENIHDLHIWSVDGEFNVLTIHVVLKNAAAMSEQAKLKSKIRSILSTHGIQHATIEFETATESCELASCNHF